MPNGFSNTQAPKTGSSQNALKRGFHAVALQPGEDAQAVHDLQQEICTEYAVRSELDRFLVSKLQRQSGLDGLLPLDHQNQGPPF